MKSFLARFRPSTLASRLVVVAALLLLVAQLISFALLVKENRRQWVTVSAAPAALRIIDTIEGGDEERTRAFQEHGRIAIATRAPAFAGRSEPAIAARAAEMFENAGIHVRSVVATVEQVVDQEQRPPRPTKTARPRGMDGLDGQDKPRARNLLRLTVQTGDGRWITAMGRVRDGGPPLARLLIWQTLLIYAAVLLPLLLIARRLSAPLGALAVAARDYSPHRQTVPLEERGPADVRELSRAFNDMQTRIGAMLAEKDHMLGAIGHDLRTPLASLRVRVESVDDADEREQMAATIEEMNQMLEDILSLARAGADRQPPQRVDLTALAEAVTEDFEAMGADSRFEESERAIVLVHAPAIRRAVRNLIDNAIKYGQSARVSVAVVNGHALLRVIDSGPGIAPDRIPEMLEPFTRLEQSRNRETGGSGLGLALVRVVMRAEGGELTLSNRSPESGLIAEIRLKLA
ncbi:ATP-binding protein [Sphingobium sufflavum]|uniref:sensor histidine kinase n=1 Tax=Sphingobium sufflavum TaxID=1129547 RepID=UPI001F1BBEEC|nr:ATP-binding protein [Sphingobium sufflavum]MCE7797476.1 ATP-binding protein [Sphingobium sufflavum]